MELLTLAIGLGLAVSLLFTELLGLATGGLVVPGYLALFLNHPLSLALTFAAALGAWASVRLLASVLIVYGRRRTVLMILFGFLFGAAIRFLTNNVGGATDLSKASDWVQAFSAAPLSGDAMDVVGFIIPGLIAIWFDKQGIVETVSALLTASVVVRLLLILITGLEFAP
jgi:gamma-polyglutamate biosynthesis protein CapC